MSPVRILQLCPDYDPHIVRVYQRTADALRRAGHSVTTAFLSGPYEPALAEGFGSATHFFDLAPGRYSSTPRAWVRMIGGYCQAKDIEVVIAQRHRACAVAARAARGRSRPQGIVVYHGLGQFRRWRRRLFARAYLRRWILVGVSKAVCSDLLASGAGLRASQIRHIPNAIDVAEVTNEQLDCASSRQTLGLAPRAFVFGTVGRLSPRKGQRFLIEALAVMADRFPEIQLAILGAGSLEPDLKQLAERHGIASRVRLLGHVPEAHRYLRALDVFVLPSLEESFGLVLLEAMAARLPIIATRTGGVPEVLGKTAELVPTADAAALADAMERLYRLPETARRAAGKEAFGRLREQFDVPAYCRAYQELVVRGMAAFVKGDG